ASSSFHILPPPRIIAGIEASMMTSEGTWRLVMPLWELTIARSGPAARSFSIAAFTPSRTVASRSDAGQDPAEPVVRGQARRGELLTELGEQGGEEGAHRVPEQDRVGDLHHRGLQVQGEQHALLLRGGDLLAQEGV